MYDKLYKYVLKIARFTQMKYVWKDYWPWWSHIISAMLVSTLPFVIYILLDFWYFWQTNLTNKLAFIPILILSIFGLITVITHRLAKIKTYGILLGTVSRDDHIENPKLHFRKFFAWDEIKSIKIVKKKIKRQYNIVDFVSTLQITPKKGKTEECYINNISGFLQALRSFGKSKLVANESYEGPSTTDIPITSWLSPEYRQILLRIFVGSLLVVGIYFLLRKLF